MRHATERQDATGSGIKRKAGGWDRCSLGAPADRTSKIKGVPPPVLLTTLLCVSLSAGPNRKPTEEGVWETQL